MDNLQLHFAPYCPFKMFLSRIINHYIYIELYVAGRRTGPVRGSAAVWPVSVFISASKSSIRIASEGS